MSETSTGATDEGAIRPTFDPARHLYLAAAPTFALMALLEAFGGLTDTLCMAAPRVLPLNGMVVMYALMSVFHAAPWLALISDRRRCATGQRRP